MGVGSSMGWGLRWMGQERVFSLTSSPHLGYDHIRLRPLGYVHASSRAYLLVSYVHTSSPLLPNTVWSPLNPLLHEVVSAHQRDYS